MHLLGLIVSNAENSKEYTHTYTDVCCQIASALDYENWCMWKYETVFQLSKLTSKINEAFIELDVPARDASVCRWWSKCSNSECFAWCWLLAVSKRMNALMKVVFHLNDLIVIIRKSQLGWTQKQWKECAVDERTFVNLIDLIKGRSTFP